MEDPRVDSKDSSRTRVALAALGLEDPRVDSKDNSMVVPAALAVPVVSKDNRAALDNTRVDMADPVVPREEYV